MSHLANFNVEAFEIILQNYMFHLKMIDEIHNFLTKLRLKCRLKK